MSVELEHWVNHPSWEKEIIRLEQLAQRQHRLSGVRHRSDQVFRTVSDTLIARAKPVRSGVHN
jgi:hypothetical protein